jgi:hypothetical protein
MRIVAVILTMLAAATAASGQALQWNGFALGRGESASSTEPPFGEDGFSTQVQLGLDWRPAMRWSGHLHLLARDDPDGAHRGTAGIVEAWIGGNLGPEQHRLRVIAGAFFLPTSRENVDSLWESPYTITSSALNSWFGEEFRPVGVDAAYTAFRRATVGVTLFRGNDTLGGLPADRGWAMHDRWTLLGEHVPTTAPDTFTSVSAETDDQLGYALRARWSGEILLAQYTRIDNRSDGRRYGDLLNWYTEFELAAAELTLGEWTLAAEHGWGPTEVVTPVGIFVDDLTAGYALISRRFGAFRGTVRGDWYRVYDEQDDTALTAAFFWSPRGQWRTGVEVTTTGEETRAMAEVRYYFGAP